MNISNQFKSIINELIVFDEKEKVKTCNLIGVNAHTLTLAKEYGIIPSTRSLIKIADYLNVSIDFLLGYTEDDTYFASKNLSSFAERLNILINNEKTSKYKLAQKWHIDKSYITKWLKGENIPSINSLEIIADYFNVSIDYLLGRAD